MKLPSFSVVAGLALAASLLIPQSVHAQVSLPFYDGFDYAEGVLNVVGSPTWVAGNGTSTYEIAVSNAAALTAPGFADASGKGVRRAPSGTSRRSVLQYASVPAVDGNTVYVSFLLNIQSAAATTQLLGYLDNNSSSQGSPQAAIFIDSSSRIGIGKKSSAPGFLTPSGLGAGTHLIVMCYTFQAGNDRVDLWVDPSSADYGAATAPVSTGYVTGGTDPGSLDFYQIYSPGSSGGVQFFDEFRVGTTWAAVTSAGAPAVGTQLGFTVQPAAAQAGTLMNPVVVQVQTAGGGAVPSNNVPVTLTLTSGGGTLSGTTTRSTDAAGKATFNDLSIDVAGTGNQLTASASGIGAGLTDALSSLFEISTEPVVSELYVDLAQMISSGFKLGGINGPASALYNVLASPDLALPQAQWIVASVHHFDAGGNFVCTNPVSPALPRQFYRVLGGVENTKVVGPSITQSPASLTVAVGQPVTFMVQADGPLLSYLWYFNGNALPGETGSTLMIGSAQPGHAGTYHVIAANAAGSATSAAAVLRVGDYAPSIITQPADQSVTVGGAALFHVAADGTAPLGYQWYYNTNTLLDGATNAQLSVAGVQTGDAGMYSVRITNAFGSLLSSNALLTVTEIPAGPIETNMIGFAAFAGVTGGAGGAEVLATNYYWFSNYVRRAETLIINVQGTINISELYCYVYGNNKTIRGLGTNASLIGDLRLNATNLIIQNLYFTGGTNDLLTIDGGSRGTGKYIWVDHCTFYNALDGALDITKGADYVTVSWCKFYYPGRDGHEYVNLIASSDDDDASQYHVTFHHNWYSEFCSERMPSVRFGRVHVFNNYYDCVGNNYCVRTRINAQVLVENNYFINVQNPWERYVTSGNPGLLYASGNITNNCVFVSGWTSGAVLIPGTDVLSELNPPPYAYTLDPAADIPYYVTTYAGSGRFPYVTP